MLAVNPSLVDMAKAKDAVPDAVLGGEIRAGYTVSYKGTPFFATQDDYSLGRVGNLGASPIGANEKTGTEVLEAYIEYNAGLVAELRKVPLENKGQKQ
jgi:creatinine amidohydrolase/Fe(II)-dependent formamide hydrolase-like protein